MNIASSRSHAILTITVEASKAFSAPGAGLRPPKAGEDIITSASLHIVDLAGSERVAKVSTKRPVSCSMRRLCSHATTPWPRHPAESPSTWGHSALPDGQHGMQLSAYMCSLEPKGEG